MGKISERIIALLLLAFLLVYVGYQFFSYYYKPLQTETVFEHTVTHNISASGVVIRQETVIDEAGGGGEGSVYPDGTRVAVGQAVYEYYSGGSSEQKLSRMREIEAEIASLEDAQNPSTSNFSNAEAINRDIRDLLTKVSAMSSTDRYESVSDTRASLTAQLNKKQIALGKELSYQTLIDALEVEYNSLASSVEFTPSHETTAPVSGYFVGSVDGMENRLTPQAIEDYELDDYLELIDMEFPEPGSSKVGKIVTNPNWYIACSVSKYDVQWVAPGYTTVRLRFDTVDGSVPGTVEKVLWENSDNYEQAVLLIRVNHVTGELLSLRKTGVVLDFDNYTGLRISTQSLHYNDGVLGVYILDKSTVRFKEVDVIYEDVNYILSRESSDPFDDSTVKLYDQIITKGMDLYDGKVIE